LLRVLARFVGCAHTELTIAYRMLDDRWCIVGDPAADRAPTWSSRHPSTSSRYARGSA